MFDTSQENVAVITISHQPNTLGTIESVNSVALSMFGYSRRVFVGKDISVIMPRPFATVHASYLQRYLETGISVRERA
jgi:PAS domain S-box-containing protein